MEIQQWLVMWTLILRIHHPWLENIRQYCVHYPAYYRSTYRDKWVIDHISTNIPNNVIATGVIPTPDVSDHDMPYIIVNIRLSSFEARFKYIRSVKSFCSEDFLRDVSKLSFSLVYAVDDPEEKISILNHLVRTCIDGHAPICFWILLKLRWWYFQQHRCRRRTIFLP